MDTFIHTVDKRATAALWRESLEQSIQREEEEKGRKEPFQNTLIKEKTAVDLMEERREELEQKLIREKTDLELKVGKEKFNRIMELTAMDRDVFKASIRVGWKTKDYARYAYRMIVFMIRGFSLRKLYVEPSLCKEEGNNLSSAKYQSNWEFLACLSCQPQYRTKAMLHKIFYFIKPLNILSKFPPDMAEEVCRYIVYIKLDHGRVLIQQHRRPERFYIVFEGKINLIRRIELSDGKSVMKSVGWIRKHEHMDYNVAQSAAESKKTPLHVDAFWEKPAATPSLTWEKWTQQWKLALLAKEGIQLDNLLNDPPTALTYPPEPTSRNQCILGEAYCHSLIDVGKLDSTVEASLASKRGNSTTQPPKRSSNSVNVPTRANLRGTIRKPYTSDEKRWKNPKSTTQVNLIRRIELSDGKSVMKSVGWIRKHEHMDIPEIESESDSGNQLVTVGVCQLLYIDVDHFLFLRKVQHNIPRLYLLSLPLFKRYPVERLLQLPGAIQSHFYPSGTVVCKNLKSSPVFFICKTGQCAILRRQSVTDVKKTKEYNRQGVRPEGVGCHKTFFHTYETGSSRLVSNKKPPLQHTMRTSTPIKASPPPSIATTSLSSCTLHKTVHFLNPLYDSKIITRSGFQKTIDYNGGKDIQHWSLGYTHRVSNCQTDDPHPIGCGSSKSACDQKEVNKLPHEDIEKRIMQRDSVKTKRVFVQIGLFTKDQVMGIHEQDLSANEGVNNSLSLVSQGAEVVQVQKQRFFHLAQPHTLIEAQKLFTTYTLESEVQREIDERESWPHFRHNFVSKFMREKERQKAMLQPRGEQNNTRQFRDQNCHR
ncbi:uncharacterized protein LOC142342382 [Convolutriloba macropyga]|uniref:uncharacterized protein LOC142342382 n=1 Tax=Convolutriloba macropyga TaxID=536237 RepID=UPI003F521BB9